MKRETELFCEGCKGYLTVNLPIDVNGLHKIICPKCNHIHYRCIEEGIVTDDRYNEAILNKVNFWVDEYVGVWREKMGKSILKQFREVGVW